MRKPICFLLTVIGFSPLQGRASGQTTNPPINGPSTDLRGNSVHPDFAMNALFKRQDGWIGADGAHSVALSPMWTLWLFSDTWVGSVRAGKRTNATIVNNSVALQDGREVGATMEFVIRRGADGKPTALIVPADGRGWFWLQAGSYISGRLYLFLTQVERTGQAGVFGFRVIGQWLGVVENPNDHPSRWFVKQSKLPFTIFEPKRVLTFGAASLVDGEYFYAYGTDEDVTAFGRDRHLIVGRVAKDRVADFSAWRFLGGGQWKSDFKSVSRLANEMGSEGSVTLVSNLNRYVLVYSKNGLSDEIRIRTAPTASGPWSPPATVFRCPEMQWDKRIFCYAAKAHASQSSADELLVSYVANSFDFWHVAADARLYWPRFVRVKFEKNNAR